MRTDQSQKSSVTGEADLKLGSGCSATPSGENDSIKVCTKLTRKNEICTGQGKYEILRPSSSRWFKLHCISLQQNCVTGHLYLGFSDESTDHFFYGTLAPVSLQRLLEVCNIKHKLPGAMASIGFPEGLQVSQGVCNSLETIWKTKAKKTKNTKRNHHTNSYFLQCVTVYNFIDVLLIEFLSLH